MRILFAIVAVALLVAAGFFTLPRAERGLALRLAVEDPVRLADLRLSEMFDAQIAGREIEAALAADDVELAESLLALAESRGVSVAHELQTKVVAARSIRTEIVRNATRFGRGFLTGEPDGVAGLTGAATGDLLIYGDVRDLAREGIRWLRGDEPDLLIAGLATAGVAVTAGTILSDGAAAPVRAGLSLFKAARRTGRIGIGLAADFGRLVRGRRMTQLAGAFGDLGRIESKAGARAALEGLRHADDVTDITRVGKLADKNGRATLAVLKTLGRGALVLGAGALTSALWVFGAAGNFLLLAISLCTLVALLVRRLWPAARYATLKLAVLAR